MTSTIPSSEVRQEITEFIQDWQSALGSRDPQTVVAHYLPECRAFTLAPPLAWEYGGTQHRQFLENWYPGFQDSLSFEIRDLEIEASGHIAICHFLKRMSATTHDGQPFAFWYRTTLALQRQNGSWLIAHEHESVPFHMDGSFLAATDLRPDRS